MHKEIERSTQVLINNGFSERDINRRQTQKILENWYNPNATKKSQDITIFYRAFFSTAHHEEERIISQIVHRNVKPADQERRIKLQIYYKNKNTSNLLLRNSPSQTQETKQKSHVVYRITCKRGNCEVLPSSYIGMSTTKLSRRLTCHLTSGAPKSHLIEQHGIIITRTFLEENTELVDMCADVRRLPILEALYIKENNPKLNVQYSPLAWSSCPPSYLGLLDRVQARAKRLTWLKASEAAAQILQLLQQRRDVAGMCVMYKAHRMQLLQLAELRLNPRAPPSQASRAAHNIDHQVTVPFARTEHYLRSFLLRFGRLWITLVRQTDLHLTTSLHVYINV
ncbi:hypothetical protein GWK47_018917 [Chionoecetes opilio]|uniref:GIY-YIG domain-containing protein n=1 Tax=Chionoecetes opilio TaxID=41210 RepID=A0A8J4XQT1_CHIOP|nr:hypothetical protein GWK47_018917 [Chionoecetes opilio]